MAVAANWYTLFFTGQFGTTAARRIDWVTDTINAGLTTSAYTPNQDVHDFYDDITNEITGTGYTAKGVTLSGKSVSTDTASNDTRLIAATSSWTSASFTANKAFVFKDTGTASTSPLLIYVTFGADNTVSAGTFSLVWDATNGVGKVTPA